MRSGMTGMDDEGFFIVDGGGFVPFQRDYACQGRHASGKAGKKFERRLGSVAHKARESQFCGLSVEKGSEPHALHLSGHDVDMPCRHSFLRVRL